MKLTEAFKESILESLTFGYALIDSEMNLLIANKLFSEVFSTDQSKPDYFFDKKIIKRIDDVLHTGNESAMYYSSSTNKNFFLNFIPVNNKTIHEQYVICFVNESSDKSHWQKEFNILFEKVPCYISIVDRNLKIIRSNEKYRDTFGENHSVFQTDLSRKKAIENGFSPAAISFRENQEFVATQVGITKSGVKCHLIVNSIPLSNPAGTINLVMEIATDITELNQLQEQLNQAHEFYSELIESSNDGIIALDNKGKVQLFNSGARNILNLSGTRRPTLSKIMEMIPEDFFKEADINGTILQNKEIMIKDSTNFEIPVKINAFEIRNKKNILGRVAFLQDLRLIKALEEDKIIAQESAIVTTFKALDANTQQIFNNEVKALDKFDLLLKKGNKNDIDKGWNILRNKFELTNSIISTFVKLSKGYTPKFGIVNLSTIIEKLATKFSEIAKFDNINFSYKIIGNLTKIHADYEMVEILMKTLISNSLEASLDNPDNPTVTVNFENTGKYVIIEIFDNGRYIPEERIHKLFQEKELEEARFGMLTVSMLVRKSGGSIKASSSLSDGNNFKVLLPL